VKWHVVEGSEVKAGDRIADMADIDPDYLARIEERLRADQDRIEAAKERLLVYQAQVKSYEKAREMKVQATRMKVKMAEQKLKVAEQKAQVAEAAVQTAKANLGRIKNLQEKGIASQRQLELAELDFAKGQAEYNLTRAEVLEARANRVGVEAEVSQVDAEGGAKVSTARAEVEKAIAEDAYARGDLAKLQVERSRQLAQSILSPVDGIVVAIDGNLGGGVVKAGQHLAKIVPTTKSRAVETFVDGNDAPLISRGRTVRIQFEGWPALQFSGWPQVAVGSFGGIVSFVDPAATDAQGRVRVLVVPDPNDIPWPEPELLRQQVRSQAWFMLDKVTLGWELWRRINGFPPTLNDAPYTELKEYQSKAAISDSDKESQK
jgi:multidrug resistance efflux pump